MGSSSVAILRVNHRYLADMWKPGHLHCTVLPGVPEDAIVVRVVPQMTYTEVLLCSDEFFPVLEGESIPVLAPAVSVSHYTPECPECVNRFNAISKTVK